jgi:hypothetical protein
MEICKGVSPSNETRENLIRSLLKTKARMSLVRGTSVTGALLMTGLVIPLERRDVTFPLGGQDPGPVMSVTPNWKARRMQVFA